ncbi:MAG: ABC transporter ATP-binding protein [Spirochaetaceae bacterium]|nr:ABC transporter ATP-binding protein [Spirochaetaceae bacterium]
MSTIKKLLSGLETKYKINSILSPIMMVGEVVMEVFIPTIMAKIIDVGIANHDANYVIKVGLIMVAVSVLSLMFGVLSGRFAATGALGFAKNLRRKLFNKVQDFSFANCDKFSTPSLITRLTTDVTSTQNTYMMIIRSCIRSPIMFISAIIMSFSINSKLALIFLVAIPLIAIPVALIAIKAFPRFRVMMKKYDGLNADVQENLNGIRVVKAFVREDYETKDFDKIADDLRKTQVKAEKLVILNMPIMQLVMYLSTIAMLWFGGNMIISKTMETGELISFITYLSQILMSLMMISMIFIMLVMSRASISRIMEILDEEIDIENPEKSIPCESVIDGSIKFDNVSFSYDKTEKDIVLSDVNIEIPSGYTVGIIGGTGSSKSTLVQLIPRLYDTLHGEVFVSGKNVKDYNLKTLRDSVAMVLQKNVLFSGTIKENLRWGNPEATDEQLIEACKSSCAHDFISAFPDGYETQLGQGGVNLSGGQKQRICIARALLKKPKILILDDSTSAVDTATDFSIRQALSNTLKETTKIIIAQRISSVKDSDVIYVMDEGKIVASGNHQQLLETSEIYREVYESQQNSKME